MFYSTEVLHLGTKSGYMKQNKSLHLCCLLLIVSSTAVNAQQYMPHTIWLRSDNPSKSVLVSSAKTDKIPDVSVIGAASMKVGDKELQYRSLLQFNLKSLPKDILADPTLISSAELILYPVPVDFTGSDENKPGKFVVRRVLQPWEDSTTLWINQPDADLANQAAKLVKVKDKNYPVTVKVTNLLVDMLQKGNNGFMICPEISGDGSMASGQLFASPKNEDEEIRPVLVINYMQLEKPKLVLEEGPLRSSNPGGTTERAIIATRQSYH